MRYHLSHPVYVNAYVLSHDMEATCFQYQRSNNSPKLKVPPEKPRCDTKSHGVETRVLSGWLADWLVRMTCSLFLHCSM